MIEELYRRVFSLENTTTTTSSSGSSVGSPSAIVQFPETISVDQIEGLTGELMSFPGPRGATGNLGPQGPMGPMGLDGEDGMDGVPGQQGPIGPTGATGPAGSGSGGGAANMPYFGDLLPEDDTEPFAVYPVATLPDNNYAFTFTTTGNIDNLDFRNARYIRANNASLATIRGLVAGYDGQVVTIASIGAGQVDLAHQDTNSTAANRLLNMLTSGVTSLALGVGVASYQYDLTTARWRLIAHEQGAYIDIAYASGNFTAQAGTWTVDSGDLITSAYYVRGLEVYYKLKILSSTTSTTPNYLDAVLPFTCARSEYANICWGSDGAYKLLFPEFDTGHNTVVRFYKFDGTAWAASGSIHISLSHNYTTT